MRIREERSSGSTILCNHVTTSQSLSPVSTSSLSPRGKSLPMSTKKHWENSGPDHTKLVNQLLGGEKVCLELWRVDISGKLTSSSSCWLSLEADWSQWRPDQSSYFTSPSDCRQTSQSFIKHTEIYKDTPLTISAGFIFIINIFSIDISIKDIDHLISFSIILN